MNQTDPLLLLRSLSRLYSSWWYYLINNNNNNYLIITCINILHCMYKLCSDTNFCVNIDCKFVIRKMIHGNYCRPYNNNYMYSDSTLFISEVSIQLQ